MKGILIDVRNKEVREVVIDKLKGLEELYQHIKCDIVEYVSLDDVNGVYVDEEGLLKLNPESKFFCVEGYPQPLCGNGLIVGTDDEGDSTDTTLSVEKVREMVSFLNLSQVRQRVW